MTTQQLTIHWQGKGNYIKQGDRIRKWDGTQLFSIYCTSIKQLKREFNVTRAEVMDWTQV